VLAGHDYIQSGVKKAVDEFALQNTLKVINKAEQYSWVINLK
jgi:hypothetical protein